MKRVLILAAGSLGAAGAALGATTVISAAPAVAVPGCAPNFVCDVLDQPNTFLNTPENGIVNQPTTFGSSLVTSIGSFTSIVTGQTAAEQVERFLVGSCDGYAGGPTTDDETSCGLVNQPGHFWANSDGTGISQQLGTFATDLASQPQTFINSITDPFGVDQGIGSGAPGDNFSDEAPEEAP